MRLLEIPMRKNGFKLIAFVILVQLCVPGAARQTRAQAEKTAYPAMAPVDAYLIADQNAEIALARSAAPASIAKEAEVMVLGKSGFTTAVKGANGFLCLVERSWGTSTDDPEFWNPKVRAPICFNAAAARSFVPIFLMKTKLVLEGKSKAEILAATASALDRKVLHDVQAAVPERPRHELASARDDVCLGRRGKELGSRQRRFAGHVHE
jgi:hypothetical protein